MKVPNSEGVANRADRAPCVPPREGWGEAWAAVHMGRVWSPEILLVPGADGVPGFGRPHLRLRDREGTWDPAGSETSSTCVRVLNGNREILWSALGDGSEVRVENPEGASPR